MARISARRRRVASADRGPDWLDRMFAKKPVEVVARAGPLEPVAQPRPPPAARMARTNWALIARSESYRAMPG